MTTRERAARLQSRTARDRGGTSYLRSSGARGVVAIPAAELLHPAGRVEDARLSGVERMARRRDLDVDDGIGAAVLPDDSSGGFPASWLPLLSEFDVAADHWVVLADDKAVRIVSPALPGHVRVASPSGRPQLDDGTKCAATHAPRNNVLMKIIPGSQAYLGQPAQPPGDEWGNRD